MRRAPTIWTTWCTMTSDEERREPRRRHHRVRRTSSGAEPSAAARVAVGAPVRAAVAALVVGLTATIGASATQAAPAAPLARLIGARLVVGMQGTTPTPALLERIRQGRVGGVILMGANVRSAPQLKALTARLRAAARAGGGRILIATDQEGGEVRRLPWAPPAASAEQLGALGEAAIRRRGVDTARALDKAGVDVDLSPVADVPGVEGSFIAAQRRAFSTVPARAAKDVMAFAAGLLDGGGAPRRTRFRGLGPAAPAHVS